MTMKLPQKAGFVATTTEWDQLVRIAENLAAQVVQAQAERDAARDELRVLRGIAEDTEGWAALFGTASRDALLIEATIKGLRAIHAGSVEALDAARADAALLTDNVNDLGDAIGTALIYASGKTEQILRRALGDDDAALRQPAPAQTYPIDDEPCENCVHGKKWHWDGGKCQNACPCEQYKPAPAGGEARL